MLVLKHVRNWSYAVLEREVRANLVYRDFTRVGAAKMPDAKTMGRWGVALGPAVIKQIHDRIVQLAHGQDVVQGRRMRVDTTVVETNIHYPTDSSLLGDGVRVLTRTMKKVTELAGAAGAKLRDRSRSVTHRLLEIGRAARGKGAKTGAADSAPMAGCSTRPAAWSDRHSASPGRSVQRRQALHRDRRAGDPGGPPSDARRDAPARTPGDTSDQGPHLRGDTHSEGKLVSLFEPSTEVIRKGKASKPTEFGKLVKLQEAENQIIVDYEVYARRPNDVDLLIPAIEVHRAKLGRAPRLVAGDAAFYSAKNEAAAKRWASSASASPIAPPRAPSASASRRNAGSATANDGAPDAKGRISVVQAPSRPQPLPLSRRRWHATLGRPRGHRRQPDQHRQCDRRAVRNLIP